MILLPIQTRLLKKGDSLAEEIKDIRAGDTIVVSSKVIATIEGAMVALRNMTPSDEAKQLSAKTGRSPEFMEAVLQETKRLEGKILSAVPGAVLTEVKPKGLPSGTILTANAGLDESNIEKGYAIGWPLDPVMSVRRLRQELEKSIRMQKKQKMQKNVSSASSESSESSKSSVAVIITDSCCQPRRSGVTAFALVVAGMDPLIPQKGKKDLFGKELKITTEAIADQLATAANALMGNASESTPIVIIREHGIPFSDFAGWVPGIEPKEDLFKGIL